MSASPPHAGFYFSGLLTLEVNVNARRSIINPRGKLGRTRAHKVFGILNALIIDVCLQREFEWTPIL
jgi:hypothetical protein